eukprot:TRINITY_DN10837_c0_g1_i4.p1 TRINITY_DN10837_c0_g1~~TRINITY_DN10837_c0_g1_i4.p1  ORF type:complete len:435 (-),score=131.46 TRINITY_DN10837_c0_g1_i4:103-1407(-)
MCIGGAWSAEIDGGDPTTDEGLITTAIRTTKEAIQLDLTPCTSWLRFMEIHYNRQLSANTNEFRYEKEITVFYLPSVWELVPSLEEYTRHVQEKQAAKLKKEELRAAEAATVKTETGNEADASKSQDDFIPLSEANGTESKPEAPKAEESKEVEKPVSSVPVAKSLTPKSKMKFPKEPCLFAQASLITGNKKPCKPVFISLDGLLDYDDNDREEQTFEVSLFAELFQEMLQRDFGEAILQTILMLPSTQQLEELRKRPRSDDNGPSQKKIKLEATATAEPKEEKEPKTEDKETEAASDANSESTPMEESKEEKEPKTEETEEKSAVSASTEQAPAEVKTEETQTAESHKEVAAPVIDDEILQAFQYFDRNRTGYLKVDDLETIFNTLGHHLSKRQLRWVITRALDASTPAGSSSSYETKIYYRPLLEALTTPHH